MPKTYEKMKKMSDKKTDDIFFFVLNEYVHFF